jgi:hypothetical protein
MPALFLISTPIPEIMPKIIIKMRTGLKTPCKVRMKTDINEMMIKKMPGMNDPKLDFKSI